MQNLPALYYPTARHVRIKGNLGQSLGCSGSDDAQRTERYHGQYNIHLASVLTCLITTLLPVRGSPRTVEKCYFGDGRSRHLDPSQRTTTVSRTSAALGQYLYKNRYFPAAASARAIPFGGNRSTATEPRPIPETTLSTFCAATRRSTRRVYCRNTKYASSGVTKDIKEQTSERGSAAVSSNSECSLFDLRLSAQLSAQFALYICIVIRILAFTVSVSRPKT